MPRTAIISHRMTVSSHLTPEPERRLWLILERLRQAAAWCDLKIGFLTALAGAELAFLSFKAPAGSLAFLGLAALWAALPLGILAFSPLDSGARWLAFLEPRKDKPSLGDSMISAEDIVKYSHNELVHRLDKYLGGGITATQYYEDIVVQIGARARVARRKDLLFRAACAAVGIGQAGLLGLLI